MCIYLYVKTHNKTGLKYLGKTTKDPFVYQGSGLDWQKHIKEHGYDVTTEILRECKSNKEIATWGRYYSELWNVAKSVEWANRIPETGGGGDFISGDKNPMKRPEIAAKRSGDNHHNKKQVNKDKISKAHLAKGDAHHAKDPVAIAKRSGDSHYTKVNGLTSKDNPFYDHTVYCWENIKNGQREYLTQNEFQKKYGAGSASTSSLIHGRIKSTVGWKIVTL